MTTDTQDFSHLRALAEAGTPEMSAWFEPDAKGWCIAGEAYDAQSYIAAANPATVIALLDALEALQAELTRKSDAIQKLWAERDSALARLAELEAQEPVAWVEVVNQHEGPYHFHGKELLDSGKHHLFAAAGASPQPVQTSRDHRGEIIDVLCDDVFGETYKTPQTAQPDTWTDDGGWEFPIITDINARGDA